MKREPPDIEAIFQSYYDCHVDMPQDVSDLIAEVRRLRRHPRVPARLVRMARDWDQREPTWEHRYAKCTCASPTEIFARAILAEAKKGKGK